MGRVEDSINAMLERVRRKRKEHLKAVDARLAPEKPQPRKIVTTPKRANVPEGTLVVRKSSVGSTAKRKSYKATTPFDTNHAIRRRMDKTPAWPAQKKGRS